VPPSPFEPSPQFGLFRNTDKLDGAIDHDEGCAEYPVFDDTVGRIEDVDLAHFDAWIIARDLADEALRFPAARASLGRDEDFDQHL